MVINQLSLTNTGDSQLYLWQNRLSILLTWFQFQWWHFHSTFRVSWLANGIVYLISCNFVPLASNISLTISRNFPLYYHMHRTLLLTKSFWNIILESSFLPNIVCNEQSLFCSFWIFSVLKFSITYFIFYSSIIAKTCKQQLEKFSPIKLGYGIVIICPF